MYGKVEVAPLDTLTINSNICPKGFEEVASVTTEAVTPKSNTITEEVKYIPEKILTEAKGVMKSEGMFSADDSSTTIGVKNRTGKGRR